MTAMPRFRSFVATVLAVALIPEPGLAASAAHAALAAQPADASPPDAPEDEAEPTEAVDGEVPADVPVEVPVEEPEPEPEEPEEQTEEPAQAVPEGPERPPEPTIGNGKYKAKGTGLMISGGVLLGLGVVGVITSYFLTRCPDDELTNSFACRNRQHNTFAVPATGAAALLGAVLLAVGLTYRVRYKRWESWDPNRAKTAFRPSFTANGVGFRF